MAATDKEKLIHDKGLVSVLKQLHDDLDAAVFFMCVFGWGGLVPFGAFWCPEKLPK
jgi:hypothetical protein